MTPKQQPGLLKQKSEAYPDFVLNPGRVYLLLQVAREYRAGKLNMQIHKVHLEIARELGYVDNDELIEQCWWKRGQS